MKTGEKQVPTALRTNRRLTTSNIGWSKSGTDVRSAADWRRRIVFRFGRRLAAGDRTVHSDRRRIRRANAVRRAARSSDDSFHEPAAQQVGSNQPFAAGDATCNGLAASAVLLAWHQRQPDGISKAGRLFGAGPAGVRSAAARQRWPRPAQTSIDQWATDNIAVMSLPSARGTVFHDRFLPGRSRSI